MYIGCYYLEHMASKKYIILRDHRIDAKKVFTLAQVNA